MLFVAQRFCLSFRMRWLLNRRGSSRMFSWCEPQRCYYAPQLASNKALLSPQFQTARTKARQGVWLACRDFFVPPPAFERGEGITNLSCSKFHPPSQVICTAEHHVVNMRHYPRIVLSPCILPHFIAFPPFSPYFFSRFTCHFIFWPTSCFPSSR